MEVHSRREVAARVERGKASTRYWTISIKTGASQLVDVNVIVVVVTIFIIISNVVNFSSKSLPLTSVVIPFDFELL